MSDKTIKVADVISPLQAVLNCGARDGVKLGEIYLVYGVGKLVKDPVTEEPLEALELVRGTGKVVHVQERICTIESVLVSEHGKNITRRTVPAFLLGPLASNIEEVEIVKEPKPFDKIQIGDHARKIR